jgi:subtilisin-like proprotein convertase family protein
MRSLVLIVLALALAATGASADVFRAEPNIVLPDSGVVEVTTDSLTASPSCQMTDVDIALEIEHTWAGDNVIDITHGGTTVRIVDRPGVPPQGMGVGCGADFACVRPIVFDDDGGGIAIECAAPANCGSCFPNGQVPTGSYLPNEALSAFDNADQAGEWIISVRDMALQDTGTLCAWEVRTTCNTMSVEPTTWGSIKARYGE